MGNWVKTSYPFVAACALASDGASGPDSWFAVYYKRDGLKICEKVGRASQGWTAEKAYRHLRSLLRQRSGRWVRSVFPHVAWREVPRSAATEPGLAQRPRDREYAVFYREGEINICRRMGRASQGWTEKKAHDVLMERVRIMRLAGLDARCRAEPEDTGTAWGEMHSLLQLRQAKDTAWSFCCALLAGGAFGPELLERVYGAESAGGLAGSVFPAMFGMAWANFFFAASLTGVYLYNHDHTERAAAKALMEDDERYAEHSPGLVRSFSGMIGAEAAILTGLTLMLD